MISEKELKKERDYLKTVLYILEKEISKYSGWQELMEQSIYSKMKYVWEEGENDPDIISQIKQTINREEVTSYNAEKQKKTYARMIKSAYFARIDFDDGEEVLPVYIGVATLENGGHFYVYDWRAPISSLFYDYELGEASYTLPSGDEVKGKITLKRQYKIENDTIVQIFDTNTQIIDEILREMLEGNATTKMKNIVRTIQKEQNKVIRKKADLLVVQGPAGSGKTSVAMHKIAYLLYSERKTLKNENILILSPNEIFSDYISGVLPEMGEDNVYQTTFMDYIKSNLHEFKVKGSMNEIYEEVYGNEANRSVVYHSAKLKFGAVYIHLIENFLHEKKDQLLCITDYVSDGKVLVDKEFLSKYSDELIATGKSYRERNRLIVQKILLHLDIKLHKEPRQRAKLKKQLEGAIDRIKPKDLYIELYSNKDKFISMIESIYNETATPKDFRLTIKELSDIFEYTSQMLAKNIIPFEDVTGFMYMRSRLLGTKCRTGLKYVVIDEAQDYTIMQYKMINEIFKNCKLTVLGDVNQCIMPFNKYTDLSKILNILKEGREGAVVDESYLTKTYRSTFEINEFAKSILASTENYTQVDRHGEPVHIFKDSIQNNASRIIEDAIEVKQKYNTVAVITKTEAQALEFKKLLESKKKAHLFKVMTNQDNAFSEDKIMVLPSYIAKGLEFDAVLVLDADADNYTMQDKNLFYVVVTRALHYLAVYYRKTVTKLIPSTKTKKA